MNEAGRGIDERIARVVCKRIQSMKAMVGDDVETVREIERLLAGGDDAPVANE